MNYFGHAAIACEASLDPDFLLGSMLPDLAQMARVQLPHFEHPRLIEGIRFHERTDSVFHQTPSFLRLNLLATQELRGRGVPRGPARAVAHIGTEMLIDAELIRRPHLLSAYLAALRFGCEQPWVWSPLSLEEQESFRYLLERIHNGGVGIHEPSYERFHTRFFHALRGRARLEPTAEELVILASFCADYFSTVRTAVPELLQEMRHGLFPA